MVVKLALVLVLLMVSKLERQKMDCLSELQMVLSLALMLVLQLVNSSEL